MKIGGHPSHSRHSQKPSKRQSKDGASRPPRKKALLIGINYNNGGDEAAAFCVLKGPHADIDEVYKLIAGKYGYQETDIVVLRDDGEGVQPTRVNILRAIDDLVRDARKGDRFFFHYCGHTIQVENHSNSEEDGMDECLVPADNIKIMDNELRRHLVDPLPVGSSLVAVFDSCHSASLLDLAHFRCNRIYVPWISKGRRRSDEIWNAVVRKHALPLLPFSKPATPANSPPTSRTQTFAHLPATPTVRSPLAPRLDSSTTIDDKPEPHGRPTRRATREIRELMQLTGALTGDNMLPTRPASPAIATAPSSPIVTTRRIYEAARTSRRLHARLTKVDTLEMDIAEEYTPEPLIRAGTEGDMRRGKKLASARATQANGKDHKGKRASLPLVPLRLPSLAARTNRHQLPKNDFVEDQPSRQRRTTVSRARAVSISSRDTPIERQAEKENVLSNSESNGRPSLKLALPDSIAENASWLGEERECESPAPVWPCDGSNCRDRSHPHDEEEAEVISLASCKDHQLSWEDSSGGSMTRELVAILNKDPHPTLRALLSSVSHALHGQALQRHLNTRKYKRDLKIYQAWQHAHGAHGGDVSKNRGLDVAASRPSTPDGSVTAVPSPSPSVAQLGQVGPVAVGSSAPARQPKRGKTTWLPSDANEEFVPSPPRPPLNKAKSEAIAAFDADNFQDPQLASHRPLDLDRRWIL